MGNKDYGTLSLNKFFVFYYILSEFLEIIQQSNHRILSLKSSLRVLNSVILIEQTVDCIRS